MKAIRVKEFGGPEKLQLEEVPNPKAGPGQVVVKIEAAGVNPVDVYIRAGTYARKPPLPYTPGTDGAGKILSVGEGVEQIAPGAPVYTRRKFEWHLCRAGAMRGMGSVSSSRRTLHSRRAPRCMFPTAPPTAHFSKSARPRRSKRVLVQGASGGVGIAAVQLARAAGLHVVGTASSERGRKLVGGRGCASNARPQRTGSF